MADIASWPWPRLFVTKYRTLMAYLMSTNVFVAEIYQQSTGEFTVAPVLDLGLATSVQQIDVADFGPFYVISSMGADVRQTYYRNLNVANMITLGNFVLLSLPSCGVVHNHRQQFLGANVSAPDGTFWGDLGTRSVVWSGIGSFELDPTSDIVDGYKTLFAYNALGPSANIYKLLTLGENVIAYSDAGKVVMQPASVGNVFTYGDQLLPGLGIVSGNHVAGDESIHGFIDLDADFWTIDSSLRMTKRGYREFLRPMLDYTHVSNDTRTIVSYTPKNQQFFISNGNQCLIVSEFGAYMCHQMISSVSESHRGALYGTFSDNADREARFTTDTLDFSSRGIKTVESVLVDAKLAATRKMYLYTNNRMDHQSTFRTSRRVLANPSGEARLNVTAVEMQLRMAISDYASCEVTDVLTNVKFGDQRYKRGTVPAQYSA